MNNFKRRLSLLLCFLLVFTTVFVAAPTETQAAESENYTLSNTFGSWDLVVHKDLENIYIGDYVNVGKITNSGTPNAVHSYLGAASTIKSGVTYKSSNEKVVIVNKSGLLSIKKNGSAVITITYKKVSTTINLKVISKKAFNNKLKEYTHLANAEKLAQAFLKETGTQKNVNVKITSKNRYKMLNAYKNYASTSGYISIYEGGSTPMDYSFSYYLHAPSAARATTVCSKIASYCDNYNTFSTNGAKHFTTSSIKGKANSNTITVELTKKVDADMIFGAQYAFSWDSEVEATKEYSFPIVVQRTSNGRKYYAIATVKKGSKTMKIELKNHKLVKGETYELLNQTTTSRYPNYLGNWLTDCKCTFKAK